MKKGRETTSCWESNASSSVVTPVVQGAEPVPLKPPCWRKLFRVDVEREENSVPQ
jgi:hypothetical protein